MVVKSSGSLPRKDYLPPLFEDRRERRRPLQSILEGECHVLVINASRDMAAGIRNELMTSLPGCEITFAPSIELARWILRKGNVDLVVTSPILPDGNVVKLRDTLEAMPAPPPVVIIGDMTIQAAEELGASTYTFSSVRFLGRKEAPPRKRNSLNERISSLGADLRDKLNNPLQEIVAMVFVAQAGGESSRVTDSALSAIDRAAKSLAQVVNGLEDTIKEAVTER